MSPLRWGILSAGRISSDFVASTEALIPSDHKIVAIGARDLDKARAFAAQFDIPRAYGSYEELVRDPEVDVVYIGSVNPQHLPLGKLALQHGKHVLCEKPLAMNVKETKEFQQLAKDKGLFLMEAMWSRFFPSYVRIKDEINKGTIGEVLQLFVSFGVEISEVDRVRLKELGGGGVLDIGVYCVQFAIYIFGEKPQKIIAGGHLNDHGVDESTSTTLVFSRGRTATLITHCRVKLPNEALAVGTEGTIKLESPFWCATKLTLPDGKVVEYPIPKGKTTKFFNSMGLSYQCNEVRRCIRSGHRESPIMSHKDTLIIAEVMESIRKQVGVHYLQDL